MNLLFFSTDFDELNQITENNVREVKMRHALLCWTTFMLMESSGMMSIVSIKSLLSAKKFRNFWILSMINNLFYFSHSGFLEKNISITVKNKMEWQHWNFWEFGTWKSTFETVFSFVVVVWHVMTFRFEREHNTGKGCDESHCDVNCHG